MRKQYSYLSSSLARMLNLYIVFSHQKHQFTQFTIQRLEFYLKKIVSVGISHIENIEGKKLPLSEPMLLP